MKASEWGIDPGKIGLAGSSAGGHLASTAGTRFDTGNPSSDDPVGKVSCRPDFLLLLYPVITMKEDFTHMGSRTNLLGEKYDRTLVEQYSNELHVTAATPPAFLVLADDDKAVLPRNSVEFYSQLKKNGVAAEMHIYAKGGHGFGMTKKNIPADNWPDLFIDWLQSTGVINR
jgi:acetyl esterase/lipase